MKRKLSKIKPSKLRHWSKKLKNFDRELLNNLEIIITNTCRRIR